MIPVIFTVDGNHAGMVLQIVLRTSGCLTQPIRGAGILMNDGHVCGSHETFQSLMGSRENWVARMFSR